MYGKLIIMEMKGHKGVGKYSFAWPLKFIDRCKFGFERLKYSDLIHFACHIQRDLF